MRSINIILSNKFGFKNENPNINSRGIKRSLFGRSFCSVRLFQSLEKSSVPQSTRQHSTCQPWKKAGRYYASSPSSPHTLYPSFAGATLSATQTRKKNAGQCLRPPPLVFWRLLYRQPSTSIGTPEKGWFYRFAPLRCASSVAVPRSQPYSSLRKNFAPFPVCGGCQWPQHRHPFSKKRSLQAPLFLLHLGCLELHEINSSIATGLCSFF